MKKSTLLFVLCCFATTFLTAQTTAIPDANFEAFLEANGMGDGIPNNQLVTTANINTVTVLDVSSQSISDLTGVEDFAALVTLRCQDNSLSSLNVTQNTSLSSLVCFANSLTSLDVTQNSSLSLLNCFNNSISDLDLTQNSALSTLNCFNNSLIVLDLSQKPALANLSCYGNSITSLDVSQSTLLTSLLCYNNSLTSLNIKNGNNTNILNFNFDVRNNSNLMCIEVDDAAWSTSNWTNLDVAASFNESCSTTYVPDNNFEQALINLGYDTVLDDYVLTSNINTIITLDVSSLAIVDLTGIEDFIALENLSCYSNSIASLNLMQNTALVSLYCYGNLLNNLDVTLNTSLATLSCGSNSISTLDVTQNTSLSLLNCRNNQLMDLDLSQNVDLSLLNCRDNLLTNLDVSLNTSLTTLLCFNNSLMSLDVKNGNNTTITTSNFNATNNSNLMCINVDDVAYSTTNWTNIDAQTAFDTACTLGIADEDILNLKVYPNPAKNRLMIGVSPGFQITKVELYDVFGKKIEVSLLTENTVDISEIAAGMYLVTITFDNIVITKKLIIN